MTLIETGIKIIHEKGLEHLSSRGLAHSCGVSNTAPYAQEKLIHSMQLHVLEQLTSDLVSVSEQYRNNPDILIMLGETYVLFLIKHPQYYNFLFPHENIQIHSSLDISTRSENQPLEILKETTVKLLEKAKIPNKLIQRKVIAMWALIRGPASITTISNCDFQIDWKSEIRAIIQSISIPYREVERGTNI